MKGRLPIKIVATVLIVLIAVGVLTAIMMETGETESDPNKRIMSAVDKAGYPICGDYGENDIISLNDLTKILYARWVDNCRIDSNKVVIDTIITRDELRDIAKDLQITGSEGNPLVVYREGCESLEGFKGIIVGVEGQELLFDRGETIEIKQEGKVIKICRPG